MMGMHNTNAVHNQCTATEIELRMTSSHARPARLDRAQASAV